MKKVFYFLVLLLGLNGCSKERRSNEAAAKMQDFVINISAYARQTNPGFILIPQNGVELAFNNLEPSEGFNESYLSAIDGFGVEELFYNGNYSPNNEVLDLLKILKTRKKVLVSEFIKNDSDIPNALELNQNEEFICFPRNNSDYNYHLIPENLNFSNANDVNSLDDVQNYLYLISTDDFNSKVEMLNAIASTNYDLILIDLFFNEEALSPEDVNLLKNKANGARRLVIAYMNIGSAEKFRYYWKSGWGLHHPLWIKRKYEGYDDEFWVKFWVDDWQKIIYGNENSYTKRILNAGFDGAYLDNVEAYYFDFFRE